ncbi:MAG: endonuclease [Xanthomonadales bacterium]|jgi:endonuclease I|nr:endonuclease [Xanthomonadales bacterium]
MRPRFPKRLLALLALWPLGLGAQTGSGDLDAYYATVDDRSAAALRETLHAVIDDHQRFPYTSSSTDTWDILEAAQRDPEDERRIITIYRNSSELARGGGNDFYNREHSWPRSYGFPDNDGGVLNYPFTDTHALFLSDPDYNFARSNKPYQECAGVVPGGCEEWPTEQRGPVTTPTPGRSNWTVGEFTEGRWEVWDGRKGDIARAQFYMDIRYEGGTHGGTGAAEPDLRLTNDRALIDASRTDRNEDVAYMGMLDTLLAWHLEDPPDEDERRRNDVIEGFQGNRNPFVDRPEWVACLYLDLCGFTINAGLNDAWFDPATAGQGFFVTVFPESKQLFLAHFTFDTERPAEDASAVVGAPGHRWITAIGPIEGNRATLTATLTSGGLFDDPAPVQNDTPYGSYVLTFDGCASATLTYEFPEAGSAPGLSGEITLQRVVPDNIALCESLAAGDNSDPAR